MHEKKSKLPVGKQSREVAEKTKERILIAALKVFANEGYSNAGMREISKEAGTTHSLISHHFGSKEQLWKVLVEYGLEERTSQIQKIIDSFQYRSPVDLLKEIIKSHILFFAKHSDLAKILLHANGRDGYYFKYILQRQEKLNSLLEPIFLEVQECGFFPQYNFNSFTIYLLAIAETPVATYEVSNGLLGYDIRSSQGIAQHIEKVISLLFTK